MWEDSAITSAVSNHPVTASAILTAFVMLRSCSVPAQMWRAIVYVRSQCNHKWCFKSSCHCSSTYGLWRRDNKMKDRRFLYVRNHQHSCISKHSVDGAKNLHTWFLDDVVGKKWDRLVKIAVFNSLKTNLTSYSLWCLNYARTPCRKINHLQSINSIQKNYLQTLLLLQVCDDHVSRFCTPRNVNYTNPSCTYALWQQGWAVVYVRKHMAPFWIILTFQRTYALWCKEHAYMMWWAGYMHEQTTFSNYPDRTYTLWCKEKAAAHTHVVGGLSNKDCAPGFFFNHPGV
jgi:hypothetical protein